MHAVGDFLQWSWPRMISRSTCTRVSAARERCKSLSPPAEAVAAREPPVAPPLRSVISSGATSRSTAITEPRERCSLSPRRRAATCTSRSSSAATVGLSADSLARPLKCSRAGQPAPTKDAASVATSDALYACAPFETSSATETSDTLGVDGPPHVCLQKACRGICARRGACWRRVACAERVSASAPRC
eukprot:4100750-Pleurochrysis_carterae.AAC.3